MEVKSAVTAQLISAFVFAAWIVQSLFYIDPKFQASSHLLWLYSPVCVGTGDRFSHNEARINFARNRIDCTAYLRLTYVAQHDKKYYLGIDKKSY